MIEKNKSGIELKKKSKINVNLLTSLIFFSTITVFNYLKIENGNENYYDFGLYINYLLNYFDNDLIYHTYGHLKITLYPFALLFNQIELNYSIIIILLIKNICFLFPLFLFQKYSILVNLLIILNPFLYYNILGNFNFDFLAIPLFFIYLFKVNKSDIFSLIVMILIILVKEVYFFILLPLFLYDNKDKLFTLKIISFSIILIIEFIIIYYLILIASEVIKDPISQIQNIKNNKSDGVKYIATFIYLLVISIFYCSFFKFKDLYKIVIFIPYFLILIYLGKDNYINIFNHYLLPLYPFLIRIVINSKNSLIFDKKKIFNLIFLFVVSSYPLSINFFTDKITSRYYIGNYFDKNILKIVKNDENKNLSTMNNKYSYNINYNNKVLPFPIGILLPYREYFCYYKCDFLSRFLNKSNYKYLDIYINNKVIFEIKDKVFFYDKIINKETYINLIEKK